MAVIGWVSTTDLEASGEWADAPEDPTMLASYLTAAYEQCRAYLPHRRDADGVLRPVEPYETSEPSYARCALAQLMQARALYRAALAGSGDQIGPDGLTVTVFPMDWTVKNLLRPKRVGRVL